MLKANYEKIQTFCVDYFDAFLEFIIIFLCSNLPMISIVIYDIFKQPTAKFNITTITNIISTNVSSGEVFIYVATLISPALYLLFKYHRARRHLRLFPYFVFVQILILFLCAIFLTMYRSDTLKNIDLMNTWSLFIYIISIFCWYASLVFARKITQNPYSDKPSGADNLLKGLK